MYLPNLIHKEGDESLKSPVQNVVCCVFVVFVRAGISLRDVIYRVFSVVKIIAGSVRVRLEQRA